MCLQDIRRDRFPGQSGEFDLRARPRREATHEAVPAGCLHRPRSVGRMVAITEELRGIHPRRHVRDPVKGRWVAPVEVFDRPGRVCLSAASASTAVVSSRRIRSQPSRRAAGCSAAASRGARIPGSWASHIGAKRSSVAIVRLALPGPGTIASGRPAAAGTARRCRTARRSWPTSRRRGPARAAGRELRPGRPLADAGFAADKADRRDPVSSSIEGVGQHGDLVSSTDERRRRTGAALLPSVRSGHRPSCGPRTE